MADPLGWDDINGPILGFPTRLSTPDADFTYNHDFAQNSDNDDSFSWMQKQLEDTDTSFISGDILFLPPSGSLDERGPGTNSAGQPPEGTISPSQLQNREVRIPPKVGSRFSSSAVRVLRSWLASHEQHPYTTAEDVELLQNQTGLTKRQVTNWLINARRRTRFQPSLSSSPVVRGGAEPTSTGHTPIDIPPRRATPAPLETMNPLQRWEISPPEHEAATVSAISRAVAASSATSRLRISRGSSGNASSVSSVETSHSSMNSASHTSAHSHNSRTSIRSLDPLKQNASRRRRRPAMKRQENSRLSLFRANMYQCTFCTETFKTKYDWQRHEKSLHLSLEEWVCSPLGPTAVHPEKGLQCVYCGEANPDQSHLCGHNHDACLERSIEERTFHRKDHLQQHLKLVHASKYMEWPMEQWKITGREIQSRCGFCGISLASWASRTDHLAEHFKTGKTMADWKGNWGFDPQAMEMLENSMPPYLIHLEQNSPLPFCATTGPVETPASAYELIKMELDYYMQNFFDTHGRLPSDPELQYEGCSVVFGADFVSHSSTSADPSWLRDVILSSAEVSKQARLRHMTQVAKLRLTRLKINGKGNIFENCELELQLCRLVAMHESLGLSLSTYELQQEAAHVLGRIEAASPNPSVRFMDFLVRLIWGSSDWLVPLRQRGQHLSLGNVADAEDLQRYKLNLDAAAAQPCSVLRKAEQAMMLPPERRPGSSSDLRDAVSTCTVTAPSYRLLTIELSRFVARTMSPNNPNSHVPTDDELKYQARWIWCDEDDDPWNQTPADNDEWLREFKSDVGLLTDDVSESRQDS
ncbi:hypothetical protein AK830_g960 [Neonectria ditissima]|uniref:Homeobox domain-containing protein n=1 Tax=Neonectria ditissima TaxID=78410 RepID=A0A0P7BNV8_9HYPO|nr:hypothetical protein AK830_g960 [Neonectria ditissima]